MQQFDLLIDGQLVKASGDGYFDAINPSNGEALAKIADAHLTDAQTAIR
ncbi:MAG: hypothetical protein HQL13_05505, partial [Candidatus Omnitrophica bacterium]|nr:hypothetical protein [Candidatus Omnitrophota bacterium]